MGNVIQVSKAERKMNSMYKIKLLYVYSLPHQLTEAVVVSAIEEEEEAEEATVTVLPEMETGPVKSKY
jgi:hypothetical protein